VPSGRYAPPQLHTHLVFFNLAETENGETRPVQPQELYRTQYATAVYRSELAHRLLELGYEVEHGKSANPKSRVTAGSISMLRVRAASKSKSLAVQNQSGAAAAQIAAQHA
jgi:conjugative relaxase-like TrwC/TraI family protein